MGNTRTALALLAMLLVGCDRAPVVLSSDPEERSAPLSFTVHPYDVPSRLMERYQPLQQYLAARLGRPIVLTVATSYHDQIRRVARGDTDLAYTGPTSYLRLRDRYTSDGKSVHLVAGESPYVGAIVVRADSGIRTLADLRGRTIAFGTHHSLTTHYMPRVMLMDAGIHLADLTDYSFLGRHDRTVLSVLHGDFDAGGTTLGIAQNYLRHHPELRILAESPPLPPLVVLARPGLDPATVEQVRLALLEPDFDGIEAMERIGAWSGFRMIDDAEFDFAREVVAAVEAPCQCARR